VDDLTALAFAARGGDREALERFVRAAQPDVWRFCAYLVAPEDADDLTQDTFVRAVGALARYRGDAPARPWLLAIARHACADSLRRAARGARRVVSQTEGRIPPTADGFELWDLIERLDRDRREAFVLTQVLGFSYAEAAQAGDCPIGTIRSRVARARAVLVEQMSGTSDGVAAGG
jgi:RNA polymerase sigma-70 factor (ECF subfamily)